MNKSILIGIAGGTGSGKTHIAKSIKREIQNSTIVVIEQDSYYKDLSHFNLEYRNKINFDMFLLDGCFANNLWCKFWRKIYFFNNFHLFFIIVLDVYILKNYY